MDRSDIGLQWYLKRDIPFDKLNYFNNVFRGYFSLKLNRLYELNPMSFILEIRRGGKSFYNTVGFILFIFNLYI